MSEEGILVDDLVQMVEREMLTKMALAKMTYDARHVARVEQESEEILRSLQSGPGDPLGEARIKVRDAIRDWVDVVNNWLSRGEEP